jgi:hypothetical protein
MGVFQVPLLVGPIGRGFVECFVLLLISENQRVKLSQIQ